MKPGRPARCDYEYERNGVANLFMMFAPLEGWRCVKVTDRHTAVDYAHVLKDLADTCFPAAKVIVLVQDNLNIHSKASLYEAFPAAEARRLVERFECIRLNTAAGSTWPIRSPSCRPNVSTAAYPISKSLPTRSPPGNKTAIKITPRPIGASQPRTLASNSSASTLQSD